PDTSLPHLFSSHAPPPTVSSPLSLHDALPIFEDLLVIPATAAALAAPSLRVIITRTSLGCIQAGIDVPVLWVFLCPPFQQNGERSEEHTSELQSRGHLVCRLLLEKKKKT